MKTVVEIAQLPHFDKPVYDGPIIISGGGKTIIISESLAMTDFKSLDLGPGVLKTTTRMIQLIIDRLRDGKTYSFGPVPSGRAYQFSSTKTPQFTGVSRVLSALVGKTVYFQPFKRAT